MYDQKCFVCCMCDEVKFASEFSQTLAMQDFCKSCKPLRKVYFLDELRGFCNEFIVVYCNKDESQSLISQGLRRISSKSDYVKIARLTEKEYQKRFACQNDTQILSYRDYLLYH